MPCCALLHSRHNAESGTTFLALHDIASTIELAFQHGRCSVCANACSMQRITITHIRSDGVTLRTKVWGGCLGRLPKRSMLASLPPPPHLTGHLFVIDLAAVDRGWAMVRASAIHAEGFHEAVPMRKWAAMAELSSGARPHRGFACVRAQCLVLPSAHLAFELPNGCVRM